VGVVATTKSNSPCAIAMASASRNDSESIR
jgi:hypothetical protein